MTFNKAKCRVLYLGQGNSQYPYWLEVENTPAGKGLEMLVDEKLDVPRLWG